MMKAVLLLLPVLFFLPTQEDSTDALVVERNVHRLQRNTLDEKEEVRCRERITLQGNRMRIDDLTFGVSWQILGDKKILRRLDPLRKRYSEMTFKALRARQDDIAAELKAARERVPETQDEKELTRVLECMGRFAVAPKAEWKKTGLEKEVLGNTCPEFSLVLNERYHRLSVFIDSRHDGGKTYFGLLAEIGAFPEPAAEVLKNPGGFPVSGVERYLFLSDRLTVTFDTVSVKRETPAEDPFTLPGGLEKEPISGFEPEIERQPALPEIFRKEEEKK